MSATAASIVEWVSRDVARGVNVDDILLRHQILHADDPIATINAFPALLVTANNHVIWDIEYAVGETRLVAGFNLMTRVLRLRLDVPKLNARKN